MTRSAGDGEGRVEVTRRPRRETQRNIADRWFVAQWRRPASASSPTEGKTRNTGWIDLAHGATFQEAKEKLDAELAGVLPGDDGLTEYRIVRRLDTPWDTYRG